MTSLEVGTWRSLNGTKTHLYSPEEAATPVYNPPQAKILQYLYLHVGPNVLKWDSWGFKLMALKKGLLKTLKRQTQFYSLKTELHF